MKKSLSLALAATALLLQAVAAQAGELKLYQDNAFRGREVVVHDHTRDLSRVGFNDKTSSLIVRSGRWQICMDADFQGYCAIFEPGEYPRLDPRFNDRISSARDLDDDRDEHRGEWDGHRDDRPHGPPPSTAIVFEQGGMHGRSVELHEVTPDFVRLGFNDRSESLVVRGGPWEFCHDSDFRGRCEILEPGDYRDLDRNLFHAISSARPVRR